MQIASLEARYAADCEHLLGRVRYRFRCDFVVPAEALPKLRERDPRAVVSHHGAEGASGVSAGEGQTAGEGAAVDDPYAAFKVPDDLMW